MRGSAALGILVAGYLALAVVAGAANSPLTVLLPPGVRPPAWATGLAGASGLDRVGRGGLTGLAWILMIVVLGAFAVVLLEAWSRRIRLPAILFASGASLAISIAAPLLLSRDVYTYAAWGRIQALYGRDPYVAPLSSFPHDPFVTVASGQWLHTHSIYGPAFTLASAAIAATTASAGATILAFKLLAGLAIAVATVLVAWTAARSTPERAPFAAALVGLNPVLVVHTVGGGHVDALIAAPLAAALAIATTRPAATSARAIAVTLLLTLACLVKVVIVPALALWLCWVVRSRRARRGRVAGAHVAVIAGSTVAALAPFVHGRQTVTPLASLGGVEAWASPSHLVGRGARAVAGSLAGPRAGVDAAGAVELAFLLLAAVLVWRLARGIGAATSPAPAETWGVALLLVALALPYLLPWYAAWFAPFVGLFADGILALAGAFATGILAFTLIPADPFHGLTTPAVMLGVHYGAASALLVLFLVVGSRVRGSRDPAPTLKEARHAL